MLLDGLGDVPHLSLWPIRCTARETKQHDTQEKIRIYATHIVFIPMAVPGLERQGLVSNWGSPLGQPAQANAEL